MPDAAKPTDVMKSEEAHALNDLVDRAREGDEAVLPELRKWLQKPALVDRLGGDLARQAERSLVNAATGKNLMFREAILRKMELMRAEL